jgi:hypothetical protein
MSFLKQCLACRFILARQLVIQLAIFRIGFSFPLCQIGRPVVAACAALAAIGILSQSLDQLDHGLVQP